MKFTEVKYNQRTKDGSPVKRLFILGIPIKFWVTIVWIKRDTPTWDKEVNYRVYTKDIFPFPNDGCWALRYTKQLPMAILWMVIYNIGLNRLISPIEKKLYKIKAHKNIIESLRQLNNQRKLTPKYPCI